MEVLLVYLSGVVLVAVVMGFIWWKSGEDLTIRVAYMLGCLMLLSYFSFVLMLCVALIVGWIGEVTK